MSNKLYIHLGGWIFYISLVLFFKSNNLGFAYAAKHTLVTGSIAIALYYCYAELVINRFFEKKKYISFGLFSLLTMLFFFVLRMRLEVANFPEFYGLLKNNSKISIRRTVFAIILISMFITFMITVLENRFKEERKALALMTQHNEAHLSYLKAQINPHFLFNALNNIYSLAVAKSDATPKMVLNLSDLLRYSIYEGKKGKARLRDEIDQIHNFFSLYRISKEEEPNIAFTVNGKAGDLMIEPMILIPLVENCVKHSDIDSNAHGYIRIDLKVGTNGLAFTAKNTKDNALQQKDGVGGVGLENIQKRLQIQYPERHRLSVIDEEFTFEVKLELKAIAHD